MVGVLNILLKQGETFDTFKRGEHGGTDYAIWYRSISRFRIYYGLEEFSIWEIDKYLWMLAKERRAMRATSSQRLAYSYLTRVATSATMPRPRQP